MAHPGLSGHDTEGAGDAAMIAALGAIGVLTTLTACSSGNPATNSPAASTAVPATASTTLAGPAAGTASVKPRNGLIAFMRPGTASEYDIWVVRPDGTGLRRVTESPANRSDYYPDWSPDGSTLLFERPKLGPGL